MLRGERRSRHRLAAALIALGLLVVGCTPDDPEPPPPTPTEETEPFTIATTSRVTATDPAAATGTANEEFVLNVFQRLMTTPSGEQVLKPDLATDCLFDAELVYMCTLRPDAQFSSGAPITSDDVKFSIERSQQLSPNTGDTSLWGSLDRIETPDEHTVRFVLNRPDTQFGFALATPSASIVDDEIYPPTEVLTDPTAAVGSGPFTVADFTETRVVYQRNDSYQGPTVALLPTVVVKTFEDSASIEEAMTAGEVNAAWRGLSEPAHTRMGRQIEANDGRTDADFGEFAIPGGRVVQLQWDRTSPEYQSPEARRLVRDALQDERTLDSIVPPQIPGHASSFRLGGLPEIVPSWDGRRPLRLGYDDRLPDAREMSTTVRDRIEATGAYTVELVGLDEPADLRLVDLTPGTSTAVGWVQDYLDRPVLDTAVAVRLYRVGYGQATDDEQRNELIGGLQRLAAIDATVVPVWQSDEKLYIGASYGHDALSFGPGWQLGLWGFRDVG